MVPDIYVICENPACHKRYTFKNRPSPITTLTCPSCKHITKVTPQNSGPLAPVEPPTVAAERPTQAQERPTESVQNYGTLVVHDEKTPQQIYPLKLGLNSIGKQSQLYPTDFNINTEDTHMSRLHCTLEVKPGREGKLVYIIQDGANGPDGNWKYSLNGTFLNGQETRLTEQDRLYLKESDYIQVGETKIVLKVAQQGRTPQQAARQVNETPHPKTVKIRT